MAKTTFRIGGVHPDDAKLSRGCAIEVLPLPQVVYISMAQHLGAPAKPIVAVGDKVKAGQVIAGRIHLRIRALFCKRHRQVHCPTQGSCRQLYDTH